MMRKIQFLFFFCLLTSWPVAAVSLSGNSAPLEATPLPVSEDTLSELGLSVSFAGSFDGQFRGSRGDGRLTLVLRQDQGELTGNLTLDAASSTRAFSIRGTVTAQESFSVEGVAMDGSDVRITLNAAAVISEGPLSLTGTFITSDDQEGEFEISQLGRIEPVDLTGSFSGSLGVTAAGSRATVVLNLRQTGDQISGDVQIQAQLPRVTLNAEVRGTVRGTRIENIQVTMRTVLGPVTIGSGSAFFTSDGTIVSGTLTVSSRILSLQESFAVRRTR